MEELVVKTAVSGDMMGEPCCELEATEDALMAEAGTPGMVVGCVGGWKAVWTWLGRERLREMGSEDISRSNGGNEGEEL